MEPVAALDKIEYMEKPKLLFFAVDNGKRASCITQLQERTGPVGAGVLVAVIDSGIDYAHPDFRRADGTTRIVSLWDQTIPASGGLSAPAGYFLGTEYDEARINEALAQPHGTAAVCGLPEQGCIGTRDTRGGNCRRQRKSVGGKIPRCGV